MSIYSISFSPTGGTLKVADTLAAALGNGIEQIDLCAADSDFSTISLQKDDLAVIAMPAYGGRMPAVAAARLAQIRGNGAKAVLAAVYGNRAIDDLLLEMKDVAEAAGFECIAGISAVAEHVFARQYGAGRPDSADEAVLRDFAAQILMKLDQGKTGLNVPGNRPYRAFGGTAVKPIAKEGCTKCGLCAQKCPVGAISPDDPFQTDTASCISCMRCVVICPTQTRAADPAPLDAIAEKLRPLCSDRKDYVLYLD